MKLLIDLLWIFTIFSFIGWVGHFIFRTISTKKAVNPGFITLPFLPSYGMAAVLLYLLASLTDNLYMIFLGSGILITVFKFFASMIFERVFGFKWHNYSNKSLNLNGYVSAYEPLAFGAISCIAKEFIFPLIEKSTGEIDFLIALLIPAIITGLIITDYILSTFIVIHLRANLKQMKNISDLLDENSEGLDDTQLRAEYEKKLFKSKRFRRRLVAAFPDMESVNYEKQLRDVKERFNIIREKNKLVYTSTIEKEEDKPFAYGLSFTKLFWLFFVGSLFGTLMETVWALVVDGHFEVRVGMVWGPFIPVYGGGAVAITLCLYKLHKANDIVIYLASAIIGATFEYFCSFLLEKTLGIICWDYSDTPFNIDGRTNLMFAMIWGLLGLFWLRYIYPSFSRAVEKIPKKPGTIITIILVIFMSINGAMTTTAVYRKTQRDNNVLPSNAFTQWIDNTFTDEYMEFIFPHMQPPEEWQSNEAKLKNR